jgi:hypothetical protein
MYFRVWTFLRCSGNIHLLGEFNSPGTRKKTFHRRLHGATGVSKSKALKISPAKHFSRVFHSSRPFRGYHLHEFDSAAAGVKLSTTSVSGAITRNFKSWTNETDMGTSLTRANVNQAAAPPKRTEMKNLLLISILFMLGTWSLHASGQCSNTNYGSGVTCIQGSGHGGAIANETSMTTFLSATAGHAIIATAYTCADSNCQNVPTTTMSISDNLHSPETCFVKSPHSPFALNETSAGTQKLQQYMWVCPSIPSGVNSFTATCSTPNACSYITLTVTEWTGLATSNVFDVDGGEASTVRSTTATVSTSAPTVSANDLVYTFFDTTSDDFSCAVSPYLTALQFFAGNINTAHIAGAAGSTQTAQITWSNSCPGGTNTNDDWYGTTAAIRTAASASATAPAAPTNLTAIVH